MDAESFASALYRGLATRKRELTTIRLDVQASDPDSSGMLWLLRAGVVFAYAHWEGFVKDASLKYLRLINSQNVMTDSLHSSLQAACLISHFGRAKDSVKVRYLATILDEMDAKRCERFAVNPEKIIDTQSNLSSPVFRDIVTGLGLEYSDIYETRKVFMDEKLLKGRNEVAHGEIVNFELQEVIDRIDGALLLLDVYADQLVQAANHAKYLARK